MRSGGRQSGEGGTDTLVGLEEKERSLDSRWSLSDKVGAGGTDILHRISGSDRAGASKQNDPHPLVFFVTADSKGF